MAAKYSWIFADIETHAPIQTLKDLKNYYSTSLGFFLGNTAIGKGELYIENRARKHVHTESTRIFNEYRRKGHGLHLYRALIECARKLGAKRIYASKRLNQFSTKMWSQKLGKAGFDVKIAVQSKKCYRCKCSKKIQRYYIDL